jgi:hypothetical protein
MNISTFNIYGEVDDILLWLTQRYRLNIVLDSKGDDIRMLYLPNGSAIFIDRPAEGAFKFSLMKNGNTSGEYNTNNRQSFYDLLDNLIRENCYL